MRTLCPLTLSRIRTCCPIACVFPDTPLATPESGWFHHIGYWVDEFDKERDRLGKLGYPPVLTNGTNPLLNLGPGNIVVEPCNLHRDQPYLRDLYPADSPFAGEPEFPVSH